MVAGVIRDRMGLSNPPAQRQKLNPKAPTGKRAATNKADEKEETITVPTISVSHILGKQGAKLQSTESQNDVKITIVDRNSDKPTTRISIKGDPTGRASAIKALKDASAKKADPTEETPKAQAKQVEARNANPPRESHQNKGASTSRGDIATRVNSVYSHTNDPKHAHIT